MKQIIDPSVNPYLDKLFIMYPNITLFVLKKGIYYLSRPLVIDKEGINIIGESNNAYDVHIYQQTGVDDGIVINANKITIRGISIHVENGENVCLSHFDANWTTVENCKFYGSDSYFTVFYAGPSQLLQGESTINGYENDVLDMHNIFDNNIVYTKWSGDAVSMSLQKYNSFRNNLIRGGKVAIYLCKESKVTNNKIYDSASNGIIVSLPSHNIEISNNTIACSHDGSIVVRPQVEHGEYASINHNIHIFNNVIRDSKYIGIEINNTDLINIYSNSILFSQNYGMYSLNSSNVFIDDNKIISRYRHIGFDNSDDNIIRNNIMWSTYPNLCDHAIILIESSNNRIDDNMFYGFYTSIPINIVPNNNIINNITTNNTTSVKCLEYFKFVLS